MNGAASSPLSLKGCVVLVTRPVHQANDFIQMIQDRGGKALGFPVIDIEALLPDAGSDFYKPGQYDVLIFISRNAVRLAFESWSSRSISAEQMPVSMAAIGKATQSELKAQGVETIICAREGADTEALLDEAPFQVPAIKQKRILIIKGEAGRKTLHDVLKQRGARVETVDVYRRRKPASDSGISRHELKDNWPQFGLSHIAVTSNASLENLISMVEEPGRSYMLKLPIIVPSRRSEALAKELGFQHVCLSTSAHDRDMLEALERCKHTNK